MRPDNIRVASFYNPPPTVCAELGIGIVPVGCPRKAGAR
jgi:hypothetical protein